MNIIVRLQEHGRITSLLHAGTTDDHTDLEPTTEVMPGPQTNVPTAVIPTVAVVLVAVIGLLVGLTSLV